MAPGAPTLLLALLVLAAPALAQRNLTDIPDPDPAKQIQTFQVADGFEVNLYASDPMIAKPIQMNFDSQGRLWVASSSMYPQIAPGQEAADKIIVLEDTDGDGRADKSTDFAEGLLIPTAVIPAPANGGAYVGNSTELIHLTDTDGDGKADQTRIVLSGFGTEDTHHILHTMRWGPDGRLYFNQSIYIHSHIETPHGPRRLLAGGIWQFRPETMELDVFARGFVNTWGHDFDRWGQSFATDGAFGEGINYVFPGATFVTAHNAKRILHGMNPGQPKHCGIEILSGRHLPPEYAGTVVTNDFRGNRVNRFVLSESGSGYVSRQAEDLITSTHVAFRPVDVKMGPDGAIYLADWYNPIIQHGEVDFRDPRRDKAHGRIWRITAKGRPLVKPPQMVGAPVDELLELLKTPEDWNRDHARLELKARGDKEVLLPLASWVERLDRNDPQYEHHRLEALWTYQSLDVPEETLLRDVLKSPDHRARAAAVRVLSAWQHRAAHSIDLLAEAVKDAHPRVRLEAVNGLRAHGTAEAARLALGVLDSAEGGMDENLDFALWLTMRELEPLWLAQLRENASYFGDSTAKLIFALKAIENPEAMRPLVALWREGKVPAADRAAVADLIVSNGGPPELAVLFERALSGAAEAAPLLAALSRAAAERKVTPAGDLKRLLPLIDSGDAAVSAAAARLTGHWKLNDARPKLTELAQSPQTQPAVRQASIDALALLGGNASRQTLMTLTAPQTKDLGTRFMASVALASMDLKAGAQAAAAALADAPPEADARGVFGAFLGRKGGAAALAEALKDRSVNASIATAGLRQISTSGQKSPELEAALQQAGKLQPVVGMLEGEALASFIADVEQRGDAVRGEAVYRRQSLLCMNCHAIAGAGGLVGPDLSSVGASAPVDYLVESLLNPQAKIKEGYHVVMVNRTDGASVAGVLVSQGDDQVVLRDGADNLVTIPKSQIASQNVAPVSLMPPGLTAQLRRDEFVDLVKFMSLLGKTGGLTVSKERFVRRWRVLEADRDVSATLRGQALGYAGREPQKLPWRPAYSTVSGELPLADLPIVNYFAGQKFRMMQFELEVMRGGSLMLQYPTAAGVSMWIGPQKVEIDKPQVKLDLPAGRHTITVAVEEGVYPYPSLKVELADVPGSSAQAQVVAGK